jgi:hypothetical protein
VAGQTVNALVLTADKAAELGYSGPGPFTFQGFFHGVWAIDEPVAISELGYDTEADALAALDAAFADVSAKPLKIVKVKPGTGKALRVNHADSDTQAAPVEPDPETGEAETAEAEA